MSVCLACHKTWRQFYTEHTCSEVDKLRFDVSEGKELLTELIEKINSSTLYYGDAAEVFDFIQDNPRLDIFLGKKPVEKPDPMLIVDDL